MHRMTTATPDVEKAQGFIQDLTEAERIYLRMLALTRNQSEVLRQGVSPELLELVRAKEEELRRLAALETRMGPARTEWLGLRDRISSALRSEGQAVVGRVGTVLRELLSLEEAEGRSLTAQRDGVIAQDQPP